MRRLFLRLPRYLIFIIVLVILILIFFISSVTSLQLKSAKEGTKQTLSQSISASFKPITNPVSSVKNPNNSSSSTSIKNNTSSTNSGVSLLTTSGVPIVNMTLASDSKSLSADIPATGIIIDNSQNYQDPAYTPTIGHPAKTPDTRFASKDIVQFTIPTDNVYIDSSQTKLAIEIDVQCRKSWSSYSGVPFYDPIDYPCSSYPTYTKLLTDIYFGQVGVGASSLGGIENCDRSTGICTISSPITSAYLGKTYKLYYYRVSGQDSIIKTATVKSVTISPLYPPPPPPTTLPDYQPDISQMRVDITKTDGTVIKDYDPSKNSIKISRQVKTLSIKNIKVNNLSIDTSAPITDVNVILRSINPSEPMDLNKSYIRKSTPILSQGQITLDPVNIDIENLIIEDSLFADEGFLKLEITINKDTKGSPIFKELDTTNNTALTNYSFAEWATVLVSIEPSSEISIDFANKIKVDLKKYPSKDPIFIGLGYIKYSPTDDISTDLKYSANAILGSKPVQNEDQPSPPGYIVVDKPILYEIKINLPDVISISPKLRTFTSINPEMDDEYLFATSGYVKIKDKNAIEYKSIIEGGTAFFVIGETKSIDGKSTLSAGNYTVLDVSSIFNKQYDHFIQKPVNKTAVWPPGDNIPDPPIDPSFSIEVGKRTSIVVPVYLDYSCNDIKIMTNSYNICVYDDKNSMTRAWGQNGYIDNSFTKPAAFLKSFKDIKLNTFAKVIITPFVDSSSADRLTETTNFIHGDTEFMKDIYFGPYIMVHELGHAIDRELGNNTNSLNPYSYTNSDYKRNIDISANGLTGILDYHSAQWVWNNVGDACSYFPSSVRSRCTIGHDITENSTGEVFAEQLAAVCWVGDKTKFVDNINNMGALWDKLNPGKIRPNDLAMQAALTKRVTGSIAVDDSSGNLGFVNDSTIRDIYNDPMCTGDKVPK